MHKHEFHYLDTLEKLSISLFYSFIIIGKLKKYYALNLCMLKLLIPGQLCSNPTINK